MIKDVPNVSENFPWLSTQNILEPLDFKKIFGNDNPVEVELGAGDGVFIEQYAPQFPEQNFIAVERLLGRATKIAKKIIRGNITNLRILRLESSYVIEKMCPKESLASIRIMHPDPWPKRKHHKNRLIQTDFIDIMRDSLKKGGIVRFTTDDLPYFEWTLEKWGECKGWIKKGEWDYQKDPLSEFQKQFIAEGKPIHRCAWKKA
jgi:tRNA (guanine-N7-)-methyltransferase